MGTRRFFVFMAACFALSVDLLGAEKKANHDAVIARVRELKAKPFIPYAVTDKKTIDDALRKDGLPKPTSHTGCYLIREAEGDELFLNRMVLLQRVDGKRITNQEEGQEWIDGLKVGDKHEILVQEAEVSRVGKRVSVKWKPKTGPIEIKSMVARVLEQVSGKKDQIDEYERFESNVQSEPVEFYIHKTKKGSSLVMLVTYREKEWIFARSITLVFNDKKFTFKKSEAIEDDTKVLNGGIRECFWFSLDENPEFLAMVLDDVDVGNIDNYLIRFSGETESNTMPLKASIPGMRAVARYYYLKRFDIE